MSRDLAHTLRSVGWLVLLLIVGAIAWLCAFGWMLPAFR